MLFVWILDVFFGPVLGAADRLGDPGTADAFRDPVDGGPPVPARRPTRRPRLGAAWAVGALAVAWVVVTAHPGHPPRSRLGTVGLRDTGATAVRASYRFICRSR